MIIGIIGRCITPDSRTFTVGSGKDTVADDLCEHFGFVKMALADEMKRWFLSLGVPKENLWGPSHKRMEPVAVLGGKSTREALQTLGTDWGRNMIWEDIWVNRVMSQAKQLLDDPKYSIYVPEEGVVGRTEFYPQGELERDEVPKHPISGVVISDVRFVNELRALRELGAKTLLIDRPVPLDAAPEGMNFDHQSERDLDRFSEADFDKMIYNDGDLKDLRRAVKKTYIELDTVPMLVTQDGRMEPVKKPEQGDPAVGVVGVALDSRIIPEHNPLHSLVKAREEDVRKGKIRQTSAEDPGSDTPPFMRDRKKLE